MNNITESVLIESRSARTSHLSNLSDERALETLNKAKALVMAVWQGKEIATTAQLAEFYEVGIDALKSILRRNKEEFEQDGVKVLGRDDLKFDSANMTLSSRTNRLTAWTPRSALRLGMILQESPVARQVRSVVLDIVEAANPVKQIDRPTEIAITSQAKTLDELSYHDLRCLLIQHSYAYCQPFDVDISIFAGINPIFWITPKYCLEYLLARVQNKTDSTIGKYDLVNKICEITELGSNRSDWDDLILKAKTELADRLRRQELILNSKCHKRSYQNFKDQLAAFQA